MTNQQIMDMALELFNRSRTYSNNKTKHIATKEDVAKFVNDYIYHQSSAYKKKLNKLLDKFEEALGYKFNTEPDHIHIYAGNERQSQFNRWVGEEERLKAHIKWLKAEKKKEEEKRFKKELQQEERRLKRLEKEMVKSKKVAE